MSIISVCGFIATREIEQDSVCASIRCDTFALPWLPLEMPQDIAIFTVGVDVAVNFINVFIAAVGMQ